MSGVTHSRAVGEDGPTRIVVQEVSRHQGKSYAAAVAHVEAQRAILRQAIFLEPRGSARRRKFEAQMVELTRTALALELGR